MSEQEQGKAVTIIDVARRAGVSPGTVSRVINGANAPDDTRQRVVAAVSDLGYVPNHAARSLKRRATEQVALVVPDVANPVYVQMAAGVQRAVTERGYQLLLMSRQAGSAAEPDLMRGLHRRQLDGMILVSLRPGPALLQQIREAAGRLCLIGSFPDDLPVDAVRVDSAVGVEMAVAHLTEQGRRRLAMVNGEPGTVPAERRAAGFRQALAQRGMTVTAQSIVAGDFTMASGYRAVDDLLARDGDIDGIFCANDAMAIGVLRRLNELGREVPGEVAVMGMDDIAMAGMTTPTLSSVSLRAEERGRLAAEMLLERLSRSEPRPPRVITVRPELIVRESSTRHVVMGGGYA